MMMDFFKGGGNYRGSKGLVEDRSEQPSKLIDFGIPGLKRAPYLHTLE